MKQSYTQPAVILIVMTAIYTPGCGGGGGGSSSSSSALDTITDPNPEEVVQPADSLILQWNEPQIRLDGSCETDLLGYRVNFGLSPGNHEDFVLLNIVGLDCEDSSTTDSCGIQSTCRFTIPQLGSASWYITVQAYDTYGNISTHSNEVVRTIE